MTKEDPAFPRLLVFNAVEETAVQAAHFLRTKPDVAAAKRASVIFCLLYTFFHGLFDPNQRVLLVKCGRHMAIGALTGVSELSWQMRCHPESMYSVVSHLNWELQAKKELFLFPFHVTSRVDQNRQEGRTPSTKKRRT